MIVGGKVTGNPNEIHNQEFFLWHQSHEHIYHRFLTPPLFSFSCFFLKFPRFFIFLTPKISIFGKNSHFWGLLAPCACNKFPRFLFSGEVKELETRSVEGSSQWMELMHALEVWPRWGGWITRRVNIETKLRETRAWFKEIIFRWFCWDQKKQGFPGVLEEWFFFTKTLNQEFSFSFVAWGVLWRLRFHYLSSKFWSTYHLQGLQWTHVVSSNWHIIWLIISYFSYSTNISKQTWNANWTTMNILLKSEDGWLVSFSTKRNRPHGRTHWTDPEKTWVSNSSSTLLRGPLGFGPIQFLMD